MKQKILSFLALVMLLAGLSFLLYPAVSNYIKTQKQRRAVGAYLASVEAIPAEDYSALFERAAAFNKRLAECSSVLTLLPDELTDDYFSILNVNGDGIIGYITVPKSDIMLPIYHGTGEAVLQEGAGHLEGSSFPIEGASVHSVISGHRGLPSALLFTNLDKLEVGDVFTVNVLCETCVYRITDINTVLPSELNDLRIEEGENLCSLVTCTPYGINSHRLVLRASLLEGEEAEEQLALQTGAEAVPVYLIIIISEVPALIVTLVVSTRRLRKKR